MSDIGQRRADTVHTLEGTAPFRGIAPAEISAMLGCLGVREQTFQAGEIVYRMGDTVHALGIVLTGGVRMERTDPWGETSVLGFAGTGDVFAESYACAAGTPLLVNVIAAEKTRVLFLDTVRALRPCSSACGYHAKLIANLLALSAQKNIQLSQRVFHTSPKSIRGKVLAYLSSEAARSGSRRFSVPFNRQQLADYLGVDRSALSSELSRMQREGLIRTRRSDFELLQANGRTYRPSTSTVPGKPSS